MKVLLLADSSSSHTLKWATALAGKGIVIRILSLTACDKTLYAGYENISVYSLGVSEDLVSRRNSSWTKLTYVKAIKEVRAQLKKFRPDILHSHYASSYGLLGALSGFHPFVLSVWGSDVFVFPQKSFFHKMLLKYNFRKADKILSTSKVMAKEVKKYSDRVVEITPFGIDMKRFDCSEMKAAGDRDTVVIGTIKSLEEEYGIDYLLSAYKSLRERLPEKKLQLMIVGGGSLEKRLKRLALELGLAEETVFVGKIPYEEVPDYHHKMDIEVFLSRTESFGVAVLEAGACGKPVVVSDAGGLPEVVEDGKSGFVVPSQNPEAAAGKLAILVEDSHLRATMGEYARKRVKKLYDWEKNTAQMISIYQKLT